MTYLIAILAGLVGALVGWMGGAVAAPFTASWLPALDLPFVSQIVGLIEVREICAGIGLIVGILLALRIHGGYRTAAGLLVRGVLAAIVSAAVLVGAVEGGNTLLDTVGLSPLPPRVEFEIRFPPGASTPSNRDEIQIELHTDRNQIICRLDAIEQAGERPLLRGSAPLVFRTPQRTIVMSLPGEPVRVFRLRLPARPASTPEFGPWQQVDFLEESQRARRSDVTADYAIRYRVD